MLPLTALRLCLSREVWFHNDQFVASGIVMLELDHSDVCYYHIWAEILFIYHCFSAAPLDVDVVLIAVYHSLSFGKGLSKEVQVDLSLTEAVAELLGARMEGS